MAERSTRGRNWRRPTGRMMAKAARSAVHKDELKAGRWQLVYNRISIGGSATIPGMTSIEYRMDAGLPSTLYHMNLAAAVSLEPTYSGQGPEDSPVVGAIAITKLRQGEAVIGTAGKTLIANPASTTNVTENQRAWRAWMPFMLLSAASANADTDWRISPVRLPLRGMHHLLFGERLAIILCMPNGANQTNRRIWLTVWGRFRYLVDSQYPSLSGPECGQVMEDVPHEVP